MPQYAGKNPPVNGIKHEKQDQIKQGTMLPSGIFDYETEHHHTYDFVNGVVKACSVIYEEVILHPHIYHGKDAHGDVDGG